MTGVNKGVGDEDLELAGEQVARGPGDVDGEVEIIVGKSGED